ncbi:MAG: lipopolysaccharide heptosyltransferase II [Candidatus Omnitrophota bacterium]
MEENKAVRNILVVNVNWVGDVIFSIPVFKALKKTYPQARIACLAPSRVKEILENHFCIDDIIPFDEKGRHQSFWSKLVLIFELRKRKFDIAFLLHRSLTRALLVYLAGIPTRVGYDAKNRGFLLTHCVKPLPGVVHRLDHYLNVIESFGIPALDRTYDLQISSADNAFAEDLLRRLEIRRGDFTVIINPGGNWDLKRWPKEKFSALIDRLSSELRAKVIMAGAPKDVDLVNDIVRQAKQKPFILTGQTTLKQLSALMSKVSLVVSADSGPMHLAASVKTKVIGLFGPTRPEITGPRGKGQAAIIQNDVACNRSSCYYLECPDNICMKSISVDQVMDEIRKIRN